MGLCSGLHGKKGTGWRVGDPLRSQGKDFLPLRHEFQVLPNGWGSTCGGHLFALEGLKGVASGTGWGGPGGLDVRWIWSFTTNDSNCHMDGTILGFYTH